MGIPALDRRDRPRPDPARSWPATRLLVLDARLAVVLAQGLGRDGWEVTWTWQADGRCEARVRPPGAVEPARALGSSRVSAISAAHVQALRLAGHGPPTPRPSTTNH